MYLRGLDVFFLVFHSTLILFVLLGWTWRRTRRIHLVAVALVALSWFGLGLRYGFGYCPCTDWHWDVREALGDRDLPYSYITFLVEEVTGLQPPDRAVDAVTVAALVVVAALSVAFNVRDWRRRLARD